MWQKRKCSVKNGFLTISHGTVSTPTNSWAPLQQDEGELSDVRGPGGPTCTVEPGMRFKDIRC